MFVSDDNDMLSVILKTVLSLTFPADLCCCKSVYDELGTP